MKKTENSVQSSPCKSSNTTNLRSEIQRLCLQSASMQDTYFRKLIKTINMAYKSNKNV